MIHWNIWIKLDLKELKLLKIQNFLNKNLKFPKKSRGDKHKTKKKSFKNLNIIQLELELKKKSL